MHTFRVKSATQLLDEYSILYYKSLMASLAEETEKAEMLQRTAADGRLATKEALEQAGVDAEIVLVPVELSLINAAIFQSVDRVDDKNPLFGWLTKRWNMVRCTRKNTLAAKLGDGREVKL